MLPSARAHSEERRRYANPNLENKAEGRGDQGCTNELGPEELAWHPRWDEFHDCLSRRQVFRAKDGERNGLVESPRHPELSTHTLRMRESGTLPVSNRVPTLADSKPFGYGHMSAHGDR